MRRLAALVMALALGTAAGCSGGIAGRGPANDMGNPSGRSTGGAAGTSGASPGSGSSQGLPTGDRGGSSPAADFDGSVGVFTKHWRRGFDGLKVYQLDEREVFRGTRWYRRYGTLALVGLTARRILVDWANLVRYR